MILTSRFVTRRASLRLFCLVFFGDSVFVSEMTSVPSLTPDFIPCRSCGPRHHHCQGMPASHSRARSDFDDAEFSRAIRSRSSRPKGRLASARVPCLSWEPTPNQSMKPMAPARYFATLLATNPAHGLSPSR